MADSLFCGVLAMRGIVLCCILYCDVLLYSCMALYCAVLRCIALYCCIAIQWARDRARSLYWILYSILAEIQYSPLYSNPREDALGRRTEAMVIMVIWEPGWVRVTSHT